MLGVERELRYLGMKTRIYDKGFETLRGLLCMNRKGETNKKIPPN